MPTTVSTDGTTLGYTRIGTGPALVLVDGAMCYRGSTPNDAIAKELAGRFTVFTYDRRGRGESGNTLPYSVEREVEDLAAIVKEAGGEAGLFGISSGAVLALEAAHRGVPVNRVAVYEPPFVVDGTREALTAGYTAKLEKAVADGNSGEAVRLFMRVGVGLPGPMVAMMRLMPAWPKLKRVAFTLPYDNAVMDGNQAGRPLPDERWSGIAAPSLVVDGGKSPQWMRNGVAQLAQRLPGSTYRTLPGQTHLVKAQALAPVLAEFFTPR
ncbi:alpha/beta hydrolase [Amycolatopsis rhabdoformis]|uniref:Alpha/beta hydrolase n=1 Tax=Amycolatopsis rhabdoformis TaxID=1448059 RepID=A0ABZ1HZ23_9PSEU|nr:alpha/beta hydrolase [Amycolatopsis rhabdoformis]WSE26644.1 alpha/beta hydrolase [Amycolatopsis rhabdoformis]